MQEAQRREYGKALTGVCDHVLGVALQMEDVHLHSCSGWRLHHAVDVLPGQGQGQALAPPALCLVVQDGSWGARGTAGASEGHHVSHMQCTQSGDPTTCVEGSMFHSRDINQPDNNNNNTVVLVVVRYSVLLKDISYGLLKIYFLNNLKVWNSMFACNVKCMNA